MRPGENSKILSLKFQYKLTAERAAEAIFAGNDVLHFPCPHTNEGDDISDIAEVLLKMIGVKYKSEGVSFEDYMNNVLDEKPVKKSKSGYSLWLDNGDTEYNIFFKRIDYKDLRISIYEASSNSNSEGDLRFEVNTGFYEFAESVVREMDNLLINYGVQGYYDKWGEFPMRSYLKLKSHIILCRKDKILMKSLPNINIPFKLEYKILGKLFEAGPELIKAKERFIK